jgi:GH24 family phage-related lysozyme (muramidase)
VPRLPDKTALGGPGAYPRRPVIDPGNLTTGAKLSGNIADTTVPIPLSVAHTGEEAIAKGFGTLAGTVGKLAEDELALDVIKADARLKQGLAQTRLDFDQDADYATFGERYAARASALADESASMIRHPRMRQKFMLEAVNPITSTRQHVMHHGQSLAGEAKAEEVGNSIKGYYDVYANAKDDDERSKIERSVEETRQLARQSGLIKPHHNRRIDGIVEELYEYDAKQRAQRGDTLGVIRDLEGGTQEGNGPSTGKTSERGLDFIKRKEGFSENAAWDKRQYSGGYGTKATPGQKFSRAEAEAALRARTDNIDDYIRSNIKVPMTQAQHDALVSFGLNLGVDDVEKIKDDINKGDWSTVSARMRTFNKARMIRDPSTGKLREPTAEDDPGVGELAEHDALTKRRNEEADMVEGRYPSGRYSRLSPDRRQAILYNARRDMSAAMQDELKADKEVALATGDVPKGPDGLTTLERASRFKILNNNQLTRAAIQIDNAKLTHGFVTPLSNMPEPEAIAHIGRFGEQAEASGANAAAIAAARRAAQNAQTKIRDLRNNDPVAAIKGGKLPGAAPQVRVGEDGSFTIDPGAGNDLAFRPAQEVAEAWAIIEAAQNQQGNPNKLFTALKVDSVKAREMLIEAYLKAQRRLMPGEDYKHRIIDQADAEKLLAMPKNVDPTGPDFGNYVRAAADRAEKIYGPAYAKRAVEEAIAFKFRKNDDIRAADTFIASTLRGAALMGGNKEGFDQWWASARRDMDTARSLTEIDRVERAFQGGYADGRRAPADPRAPFDYARGFEGDTTGAQTWQDPAGIFSSKRAEPGTLTQPQLPTKRTPQVDDALAQWLQKNPKQWRMVDRDFGPGTAAELLKKAQPTANVGTATKKNR